MSRQMDRWLSKLVIGLALAVVATLVYIMMVISPRVDRVAEKVPFDLQSIAKILWRYNKICGHFPTTTETLEVMRLEHVCGGKELPEPWVYPLKDPWGSSFKYESDGNKFLLGSLGADKAVGGAGEAADIYVTSDETDPNIKSK